MEADSQRHALVFEENKKVRDCFLAQPLAGKAFFTTETTKNTEKTY